MPLRRNPLIPKQGNAALRLGLGFPSWLIYLGSNWIYALTSFLGEEGMTWNSAEELSRRKVCVCGPRVDISWQPAQHSSGGGWEMDRQSHNAAWRAGENLKTFPAQWLKQPHGVCSADSLPVRASCPLGPCPEWEEGRRKSFGKPLRPALCGQGRGVGGKCLLNLCRLLLCGNTHLRRCILLFPKEEMF